jgi:hypothetical protein
VLFAAVKAEQRRPAQVPLFGASEIEDRWPFDNEDGQE